MKKIVCFLAIITALVLLFGLLFIKWEPDRCPLCSYMKSHAPCLVNVKTGEIEEMALYTPHYTLVGEIAEEQTDSTFSFVDIVGCRGTRLSSPYIMELDVPVTDMTIIKQHFCRECRSLLDGHGGFVIADLYTPGKPVIYGIDNDMRINLRCYAISAALDESGKQYQFRIEGFWGSENPS